MGVEVAAAVRERLHGVRGWAVYTKPGTLSIAASKHACCVETLWGERELSPDPGFSLHIAEIISPPSPIRVRRAQPCIQANGTVERAGIVVPQAAPGNGPVDDRHCARPGIQTTADPARRPEARRIGQHREQDHGDPESGGGFAGGGHALDFSRGRRGTAGQLRRRRWHGRQQHATVRRMLIWISRSATWSSTYSPLCPTPRTAP